MKNEVLALVKSLPTRCNSFDSPITAAYLPSQSAIYHNTKENSMCRDTHIDNDFVNELQEVAHEHQWHNMPIQFGPQCLEVDSIHFRSTDAIVVLKISQCLILLLWRKLLSSYFGLLWSRIRHDVWYEFEQGRSNQELHILTYRYCQRSAVTLEPLGLIKRSEKPKHEVYARNEDWRETKEDTFCRSRKVAIYTKCNAM